MSDENYSHPAGLRISRCDRVPGAAVVIGRAAAILLLAAGPLLPGRAWGGEPPATPPVAPAPGKAGAELLDPRRPIERELLTGIADGFTLAAVGDLITSRALAPMLPRDPEFAAVVTILREADAALGNFETAAVDLREFHGHPFGLSDDTAVLALPEVAVDLGTLGFDLLSRANNHSMDWGIEGMRETGRHLDSAGLVHAGVGENRAAARAPQYLETGKGRVGLVSMTSSASEFAHAQPAFGRVPGRPGVSALRVKRVLVATAEMMRGFLKVRDGLQAERGDCRPSPGSTPEIAPGGGPEGLPAELAVLGMSARLGERAAIRYEMDPADLGEILQNVRLGKQHSDLLVAAIHAHEEGLGCDQPGDFLQDLARRSIDAGAGAFVVHGVHQIGPIEIYRGRPIFYGLGNFVWSDIQEPNQAYLHEVNRDLMAAAFGDPARATDADLNALVNAQGFNDDRVFQTIVAVSRFEAGRASEIRLVPVDLGYGERLTRSGVPRRAPPAVARIILERLQRISRPYGTTIAIDRNVGIIRPAKP